MIIFYYVLLFKKENALNLLEEKKIILYKQSISQHFFVSNLKRI